MELQHIRTHKINIAGFLLNKAILGFREKIWKERCVRQVALERRLDIANKDKRSYGNNSTFIQSRPPDHVSAHRLAQEKWTRAVARGSEALADIIKSGRKSLNYGWGITRSYVGKAINL